MAISFWIESTSSLSVSGMIFTATNSLDFECRDRAVYTDPYEPRPSGDTRSYGGGSFVVALSTIFIAWATGVRTQTLGELGRGVEMEQ